LIAESKPPAPSALKRVILIAAAVVAAAAVALFAVSCVRASAARGDNLIYFAAARALVAGGDLYAGSHLGAGYVYPPFFALFLYPLARLPGVTAAAVWFALNACSLVLFFALALYLLERPAEPFFRWLRAKAAALAAAKFNWVVVVTVVVTARFWIDNLRFGLVNVHLWTLALAAVYLVGRGRKVAGGALLALAVGVKVVAGWLLLYLLIKREFRALAVAAAGVGVLYLLPAAFVGWGRNAALLAGWYDAVIRGAFKEYYFYADDFNQSLSSFVYTYATLGRGAAFGAINALRKLRYLQRVVALVAVAPAVVALIIGSGRRRGAAEPLGDRPALAALILAGTMAQPLSWVSYYVAGAFGYMAALYALRERSSAALRVVVGVLIAASFAAHSLSGGDLWGAKARVFYYHYKFPVWAALFLYAALVVVILGRRRRPGARSDN